MQYLQLMMQMLQLSMKQIESEDFHRHVKEVDEIAAKIALVASESDAAFCSVVQIAGALNKQITNVFRSPENEAVH